MLLPLVEGVGVVGAGGHLEQEVLDDAGAGGVAGGLPFGGGLLGGLRPGRRGGPGLLTDRLGRGLLTGRLGRLGRLPDRLGRGLLAGRADRLGRLPGRLGRGLLTGRAGRLGRLPGRRAVLPSFFIVGRSRRMSSSTAVENRSSVVTSLPSISTAGRSSCPMGPRPPWAVPRVSVSRPTLRRISSTLRSLTLSRTTSRVCWTLSSCKIRSTESLVRLLGMVYSPFPGLRVFAPGRGCRPAPAPLRGALPVRGGAQPPLRRCMMWYSRMPAATETL